MRALLLFLAGAGTLACAADFRVVVKTPDGAPVADAVVVVNPADGSIPAVAPLPDIVDQVDKQFMPYVKPVLAGTEVRFPNKDNIRHQVYSFSAAKRFELPLYKELPAQPVVFETPGVVVLGCNIHDWMIGYVYVSESPWFAKTGDDGTALIANLPAGQYRARIWHPQMDGTDEATAREVVITNSEDLEAAWQIAIKPEVRPHRAPVGREQGYR